VLSGRVVTSFAPRPIEQADIRRFADSDLPLSRKIEGIGKPQCQGCTGGEQLARSDLHAFGGLAADRSSYRCPGINAAVRPIAARGEGYACLCKCPQPVEIGNVTGLDVEEIPIGRVQAWTFGFERELPLGSAPLRAGLGAQISIYGLPSELKTVYGDRPAGLMVFLRLRPKGNMMLHMRAMHQP